MKGAAMNMKGKMLTVNGLNLHVIDEGEGPAVLLVHGFPDTSYVWRHQMPALVDAGFRVIAPDVRGFGKSDKPEETAAYGLINLVGDMVGVLDALEIEKAHVVGHDMGAAIAWVLAAFYPQRVNSLVPLSVGHPMCTRERTPEQREKSWYFLFFQFKGTAEALLSRNNWKLFREILRDHSEVEKWIEGFSDPKAFTAALNWYRANLGPEKELEEPVTIPAISVPTMGIWSSGDAYLTERPMVRSADYVTGPWRYERIEDAGHWLQLDKPAEVNRLLVEFLQQK